jgi:hypothetical protein
MRPPVFAGRGVEPGRLPAAFRRFLDAMHGARGRCVGVSEAAVRRPARGVADGPPGNAEDDGPFGGQLYASMLPATFQPHHRRDFDQSTVPVAGPGRTGPKIRPASSQKTGGVARLRGTVNWFT